MIYLYKNTDSIIIKDTPRNVDINGEEKNELDNYEIICIIDWNISDYLDIIKTNLRRWKNLNYDADTLIYKNNESVINWFNEHKITNKFYDTPSIKFVFSKEIKETLDEFFKMKAELEDLNIIPITNKYFDEDAEMERIIYDCDIWNVLEEKFGEDYVNMIRDYSKLNDYKKLFIKEFYNLNSKDAKLNYIRENRLNINIEDIVTYLPDWCNFNLIIDEESVNLFNETNHYEPEFKTKSKIDNKDYIRRRGNDLIRKEIYTTFKINEVWKGPDIKSRLEEIYRKYDYGSKAAINDINNYFEISKTRTGYRIGFRKNNYIII